MNCSVCGEAIDFPREEMWEEVIGWNKKRRGGGLHSLKLKKETGSVMCVSCMVRIENGMPQATLFDELGAR